MAQPIRQLALPLETHRNHFTNGNPCYQSYAGQYSLKAIKEEIAHKLDDGVIYLAEKATLWDDLRALFDIIYSGQETLGAPAYDGRLFDPNRYPFLEEHTIGDRYLAQANVFRGAKQTEVRGSLDWLAEYTGRPVGEWALKTNLCRYYEHDWAEVVNYIPPQSSHLT